MYSHGELRLLPIAEDNPSCTLPYNKMFFIFIEKREYFSAFQRNIYY